MIKFSALQLAAGDSSRMEGKNKLMLTLDGKSFLKKTHEELLKTDLHERIVVTGFEKERIMNELRDLNPSFSHNPDFETGMHSSIKKGLTLFSGDAFFVCLSDQPYFDVEVINTLKSKFKAGHIHVPVFDGKRGHPVLFSKEFLKEIMNEPDGDYGLSYLLKRHAYKVIEVPVSSGEILIDVDTPADYKKISSYNSKDPVDEFHSTVANLRTERIPFVLATVIEVIGSASARTGSKAIFDGNGKNLLGWVGGGCAERFIGEESVKALSEKKTRIVLADMDDEIFGLGVACGGKMRVFLEPIHPSENISLPDSKFHHEVSTLAGFYGWNVQKVPGTFPQTIEELILTMTNAAAKAREKSARPLRLVKEVPAKFQNTKIKSTKEVTIVGRTRITEALARHFTLLSYNIRAIGPDLKQEDYPSTVKCHCLDDSYENISFRKGEIVIIASHTSQDPELVKRALLQKVSYVGMVGSYKRSLEVLNYLNKLNADVHEPLYVPAGLDMDARNPDEIALSIVAEVIHES